MLRPSNFAKDVVYIQSRRAYYRRGQRAGLPQDSGNLNNRRLGSTRIGKVVRAAREIQVFAVAAGSDRLI